MTDHFMPSCPNYFGPFWRCNTLGPYLNFCMLFSPHPGPSIYGIITFLIGDILSFQTLPKSFGALGLQLSVILSITPLFLSLWVCHLILFLCHSLQYLWPRTFVLVSPSSKQTFLHPACDCYGYPDMAELHPAICSPREGRDTLTMMKCSIL